MQVKEIMTADPACCTPETSLQEVGKMMMDHDCGEIPVVEDKLRKPDSRISVTRVTKEQLSNALRLKEGATAMTTHQKLEENVSKLRQMIKGIEFAMLTTVEEDGSLRSRPMATLKGEFNGDLYFFTKASAPKVDAVERDRHVCVTYAAPERQRYVSMSGLARLVRDRRMIEEFWFPELKAWFPGGLEDPEIALLWISITQAEYWEGPFGSSLYLGGVKAMSAGAVFEDVSGEPGKTNSSPAPLPDSTSDPGGPPDWSEHED